MMSAQPWAEIVRDLNTVTSLFPAGTRVRHVNPELSDWRGTVVTLTRGPRKGEHVEYRAPWIGVRVRWDETATMTPVTGWYGQGALIPA